MQACAEARCAGLLVSVGAEASAGERPRCRARPKEPQERAPPPQRGHRNPGLNHILNPQPARVTHQTPYRPSIALRPSDVSDLDIATGPSRSGDAAWAGGPSAPVSGSSATTAAH